MEVLIVCDLMLHEYGSVRPPLLLAKELSKLGAEVCMASARVGDAIKESLESYGIKALELSPRFVFNDTRSGQFWIEAWLREAFLKLNSKRPTSLMLNFSHTYVPSTIWFIQGLMTDFFRDMEAELPLYPKLAWKALNPLFTFAEGRLVKRMACSAKLIVANSKYCASLYERRGIRVHKIIYSPIDCEEFRPTTSKPSRDFVLTCFGRETKYSLVKMVADEGIPVKAFGSSLYAPRKVLLHRNISYLGYLDAFDLVRHYSNALFTLFPFLHEPFGYVPLESMACATPVLTYNRQGPKESVIDGVTGWLANTDSEMLRLAVRLWKEGYPPRMRKDSRIRAESFDVKVFLHHYLSLPPLRLFI